MAYSDFKSKVSSEKIGLCTINASRRLQGWDLYSGFVYIIDFDYSPKITSITQDGVALTEQASVSLSSGQWYFDRANRKLYLRASDDGNPDADYISVTFTLFFSNVGISLPNDLSTGFDVYWEPLLIGTSSFKSSVDNSATQLGLAIEGSGTISLLNDTDYWSAIYDKHRFENQDVSVYSYGRELTPSQSQIIFKGQVKGSTYSTSNVSFSVANILYQLRDTLDLPRNSLISSYVHKMHGSISPRLDDTSKEWLQRTIYGKATGVVPVNIDRIYKDDKDNRAGNVGYDLIGTFTVTNGSATLQENAAFGAKHQLGSINVDGQTKVIFSGQPEKEYTILECNDSNSKQYTLSEAYTGTTDSSATIKVLPNYATDFQNRYFKVAGHSLSEIETVISTVVSNQHFYVSDASQLEEGDRIIIAAGDRYNLFSFYPIGLQSGAATAGAVGLIADDATLNNSTAFSAGIWVKNLHELSFWFGYNGYLFSKWNSTGNKRQWAIHSDVNANLRILIDSDGSLTTYKDYLSPSSVFDNANWNFVGFTFDNGTLTLYHNGVEISSPTKTVDNSFSSVDDQTSGVCISGGNDGTNGKPNSTILNNAQFWDKALSAEEWLEAYGEGNPPDLNQHSAATNLAGWWPCSYRQDTFSTFYDHSDVGNGNDATMYWYDETTLQPGIHNFHIRRDVPNYRYFRTIEQITDLNLVKITATIPVVASSGWNVIRPGVQAVYLNDIKLTEGDDYEVDSENAIIKLSGFGTGYFYSAEFNNTPIQKLTGVADYDLGSRNVDTGTDWTEHLRPGDYIKDASGTWRRIIEVRSDTVLIIEEPRESPFIIVNGTVTNPEVKKVSYYQEGETLITCDVRGKTVDGTTSGRMLRYAPEIVQNIISDAGFLSLTDTASFDTANDELPHEIALVIPEKVNSTVTKKVRDVISGINKSVFGTLSLNSDIKFQYSIIDPSKTDFITLDHTDVLSFSVRSDSSNIVSDVAVRYNLKEINPSTLEPSFDVSEYSSQTATYSLGVNRLLDVETLLVDSVSASEFASRWAFLLEQTTSIVTLRMKLQGITISVGDKVKFRHPGLYQRFGSSISERFGLVRSVAKSYSETIIELDDIGNAFSRTGNITEDDAVGYYDASSNDKMKNGYITFDNGGTPNSEPVGFEPSDISPLHWFDAGDDVTFTKSGTNITAWEDKGSLGIDLSALGSDDPQYTADDPFPFFGSVTFDNANDEALDTGSSLTGGNIAIQEGTAIYIWLVFKLTSTANQFLVEIPSNATSLTDTTVTIGINSTGPRFLFDNSSAGGTFNHAFSWTPDTDLHIVEIYYDGTSSPLSNASAVSFKLDNVSKTTVTVGTFTGSVDNDLRIGGVSSVKADAKIYELIVSNTTNASMYNYLNSKWNSGVTDDLINEEHGINLIW